MKLRNLVLLLFLIIPMKTYSKPLPIAHRGASGYAPENTMSAIRKAQSLGSKHIEIDIQMTKDGKVVALHDFTIDRTSNGEGDVNKLTFAQLRTLDFGNWFYSQFLRERIPSLEEILASLKADDVLIIEFKYGSETHPGIEAKVIELVQKMGRSHQVILKSFDMKILNTIESLVPTIARLYCTFYAGSWLTIDNSLRFEGVFSRGAFQYLQVHKYFLSKSLVERAHEKGIKVVVWDVHDKATMENFSDMGVDFIESNNPDYVLEL